MCYQNLSFGLLTSPIKTFLNISNIQNIFFQSDSKNYRWELDLMDQNKERSLLHVI